MKIKNIIFDLGGVIITLDQSNAVARFKEIGLEDAERRLDPYTQSDIFGDLEKGKISADEFCSALASIIGKPVSYEQCKYAWLGYCKELPARNLDMITSLRSKGYRIILLSNTNPFMMDWAMSAEFDGRGHSLAYYMDALYMSYKCGMMKPDERLFRHVIEAEGIVPGETLFVDDGPRNVEVAAQLGINTFCPGNGDDWTGEILRILEKE